MQITVRTSALALAFILTACGSDPAPDPVEQIVVKETDGAGAQTAEAATKEPAAASLAGGKAAFVTCSVCHNVEKGAPAKIGPNLYGIIGKSAGSVAGFQYSSAMKSSGITWSEAEIDSFITSPLKKLPGTKMAAPGISDAGKRTAIIGYIKDMSAR